MPSYPGATLGVSANGTSNGIVWAIQRVGSDGHNVGTNSPGVLHAYDATNLGTELYNSNQNATRDLMDYNAKWSSPLVVNGRVYIASVRQLTVYGLLP
jgi:hypothetical protein